MIFLKFYYKELKIKNIEEIIFQHTIYYVHKLFPSYTKMNLLVTPFCQILTIELHLFKMPQHQCKIDHKAMGNYYYGKL